MIGWIVCLFKGHDKFYFSGHTEYPENEHVYHCSRCGRESSDEQDERDRQARYEYYAGPGYAVRRYA